MTGNRRVIMYKNLRIPFLLRTAVPTLAVLSALAAGCLLPFGSGPVRAEGEGEDINAEACVDNETHLRVVCLCTLQESVTCADFCRDTGQTCTQTTDTDCLLQCKEADVPQTAEALRTRGLPNPLQAGTVPQLIGNVTRVFTGIVGSLALLMFVYGGLLWVTSRGNTEQIDKGKRIFTWSTIGLLIMFSAYLIIKVFLQTIGATS